MSGLGLVTPSNVVTVNTFRRERSDAGKRVAARRKYVGKTQESIEEETGGILKQRMLSRLESGDKSVGSLSTSQTSALMRVLSWAPDDFETETGVQLPERIPATQPYMPSVAVPFLGHVSAGLAQNRVGDPDVFTMYDLRTDGLQGRNPDVLGEVIVNGNSMVSENAARDVRNGSRLVVEFGAIPTHGDLVVAWVDDIDTAVIKKYEEGPETILRSFNPDGPVFRAGQHKIEVRGVVRLITIKP